MIKIGDMKLTYSSTTPNIFIGEEGSLMFIRVGIGGVELLSVHDDKLPIVVGIDVE